MRLILKRMTIEMIPNSSTRLSVYFWKRIRYFISWRHFIFSMKILILNTMWIIEINHLKWNYILCIWIEDRMSHWAVSFWLKRAGVKVSVIIHNLFFKLLTLFWATVEKTIFPLEKVKILRKLSPTLRWGEKNSLHFWTN